METQSQGAHDVPHDTLRVVDVDVRCLIGIYEQERFTPQSLRLSLELRLDTRAAAQSGDLARTVDYARVVGQLTFVLQAGAFRLIETAAEACCRVVLAGAAVDVVALALAKPAALGGNGVPSLAITRHGPAPSAGRVVGGAQLATLWDGPDAVVSRLVVPPRSAVPRAIALDAPAALHSDAQIFATFAGPTGALEPGTELRNDSDADRAWLLVQRRR